MIKKQVVPQTTSVPPSNPPPPPPSPNNLDGRKIDIIFRRTAYHPYFLKLAPFITIIVLLLGLVAAGQLVKQRQQPAVPAAETAPSAPLTPRVTFPGVTVLPALLVVVGLTGLLIYLLKRRTL